MMCDKCEQLWLGSRKQPISTQLLIDGGEVTVFNGMCDKIATLLQSYPQEGLTVRQAGKLLRLHGYWYDRLVRLFRRMEGLGIIRKADARRKRNVRWLYDE